MQVGTLDGRGIGPSMLAVELFMQPYCRGLIRQVDLVVVHFPIGSMEMSSEHMFLERFTCRGRTLNSGAEVSLWLTILDIQTK